MAFVSEVLQANPTKGESCAQFLNIGSSLLRCLTRCPDSLLPSNPAEKRANGLLDDFLRRARAPGLAAPVPLHITSLPFFSHTVRVSVSLPLCLDCGLIVRCKGCTESIPRCKIRHGRRLSFQISSKGNKLKIIYRRLQRNRQDERTLKTADMRPGVANGL